MGKLQNARTALELGSQDLKVIDLQRFRDVVMGRAKKGVKKPQELIMFSSGPKAFQYALLDEFLKDVGAIPEDTGHFYYTIAYTGSRRCSLYLDPDRPAKVVIEGDRGWIDEMEPVLRKTFPKGGMRYLVHGTWGIFMIWAAVLLTAAVVLAATALIIGLEPVVLSSVLLAAGILGTYLSIRNAKELQPANTITFVKRKRVWFDTLMHFMTIVLGIISAVLATLIIKAFF